MQKYLTGNTFSLYTYHQEKYGKYSDEGSCIISLGQMTLEISPICQSSNVNYLLPHDILQLAVTVLHFCYNVERLH